MVLSDGLAVEDDFHADMIALLIAMAFSFALSQGAAGFDYIDSVR